MNINEIKKSSKTMVSFEVFPPKTEANIEELFVTIDHLKKADPSFISVTYGAGGGNKDTTVLIASRIKSEYGIEPLAHLTCVGADAKSIDEVLIDMRKNGIQNILALRGDVPKNMDPKHAFDCFSHATDLIEHIEKSGNFYTMAAAYPELHPQSNGKEEEFRYMKLKQDLGAIRFNTQFSFDMDVVKSFIEQSKKYGIDIPISVGIMPILQAKQVLRMISLSGCSIPAELGKMISIYGDDEAEFQKRGIEYASNLVQKLIDYGVDGVHLYAMNKHAASLEILSNVGLMK